jgi:tetratricopeptide (TPR) repeat protein
MKIQDVPPEELIADLGFRVASKTAGSYLRFNDGEAKVAGCPLHYSGQALTSQLRRHYGTNALTNEHYEALRARMIEAVRNADWVGVPPADWPPLFSRARDVLEGPVFRHHPHLPGFTHVSFPQMMLDQGVFQKILGGISFLGLIGCRDLRRYFADNYGITNTHFTSVPEQADGSCNAHLPVHFPHAADAVIAGLQVPHPGAVFLVGAGFCGKLYCDAIKQRGGIAIDVGSLFDLWAGRFSRPYMNFETIVSYYQNRLDAWDTSPDAFHAVADYHRSREDTAAEAAVIARAHETNPGLFAFAYRKTDILLRQGRLAEAEAFARGLVAEDSAFGGPEAFKLGKLFLNAGERPIGGALLTIAINKAPTYAPALTEIANFYMGPKDRIPPGARYDVPELIKSACADSSDYLLLSQYARLLGAWGFFKDAIAASNRAIELFSYDPDIYAQKSGWENALGMLLPAAKSNAAVQSLQAAQL